MTRGANGKYLSNVSAAAPPVAVGVIALQVALDAAVQQIMTAIKDVHWVGCVGADLDCGDRAGKKALFDEVAADAEAWNATVGIELSYERLDDRRACRIATYRELNLQAADLAPTTAWAADAVVAMFDALNAPLRLRAPELRSAVLTPP